MKVLNAVFVWEFYLANSGFFLLVIVIAGGFMRSYEHIALAEFFMSTALTASIPVAVWFLYGLKLINFNQERIVLSENEFLHCFSLFSPRKQWSLTASVAALQLVPVFFYAVFLCLVALKHSLWAPLTFIVISCLILLWIVSLRIRAFLRHPAHESKITFLSSMLNKRFTKPFPAFFIEWVVRNDLAMLLGTKVFSVFTLIGITQLYQTDSYDLRLLAIGVVIGFSANASLILAFHRFENFHLPWLRGLPLSVATRMRNSMITLIILLAPEGIILIRNFPDGMTWLDHIATCMLVVSIPVLLYGGMFTKDRNQQEIMPIALWLVLVWFVMILFKIPIVLMAALNIVSGFYFWKKFYYSFEYVSKEEQQ